MARNEAWLLLAAAAALFLLSLTRTPVALWQQTGNTGERHIFRITVGLTEREARDWNGTVEVSGGEVIRVEGHRFGPKDNVSRAGSFRFTTEVANFEDQLRKTHPYGQTDFDSPEARRVVPQGLIVEVSGLSSTRVRFASDAGTFDFETGRVGLRNPLSVLGANG